MCAVFTQRCFMKRKNLASSEFNIKQAIVLSPPKHVVHSVFCRYSLPLDLSFFFSLKDSPRVIHIPSLIRKKMNLNLCFVFAPSDIRLVGVSIFTLFLLLRLEKKSGVAMVFAGIGYEMRGKYLRRHAGGKKSKGKIS